MAKTQRKYDMEYKIQAVKLAKEPGGAKAAAESGHPENTMYAWTKAAPPERGERISGRSKRFFRCQPSEVCKRQRMMFIAIKTEDGAIRGKTSFYCRMLNVTRQGFYKYLADKDRPWKYQDLADAMRAIASEDECNDTYGRIRMYQALVLKQPEGVRIPGERTVYRVMEKIGLGHRRKREPNGITKADREARKSDDLLKRDFTSAEPLRKCVTDITEIRAKDGKLYVSAIFDCFDAAVLGLAMDTNMKASLCEQTLANARCESMWARMKEELFYGRYHTEELTIEEVKTLIWRYFISYWNNRRICSSNDGFPPMVKRQKYYESMDAAA